MQKRLLLAYFCAFILSCGSGGDSTSSTEQAQTTDQTQTTPEWVGRWWLRTVKIVDYSSEGNVASYTTTEYVWDFRGSNCLKSGKLSYTADEVTLTETVNTCGTSLSKYVATFRVSGETLTGTFTNGSGGYIKGLMTWTRLNDNEEPPSTSSPAPSGGSTSGGGWGGGSQICPSGCASSGACSSHDGVDCSAGPDSDGSVICNDGWRGSAVEYSCN